MNVIPIKVESAVPVRFKAVEWMLHNVCNYNCSFCVPDAKEGSKRWLTLDEYKKYSDEIINATGGQPLRIQFTGGEPTLFPDLIELLSYIKRPNVYISLITNGSRTIRWWQELKEQRPGL